MKSPILRYHGGKWRLASWIRSHFPEHRTYVEPYCGAASVLMRKPRSSVEVVNDLNGRLINLFRVLQDDRKRARLVRLLGFTPYSLEEYTSAREISDDPVEDARRILVLGWQGHGATGASGGKLSGWRRSVRAEPWRHSANQWSDAYKTIIAGADRLRDVFIESRPALEVIGYWDKPDTLFYVDPPYLDSTRSRPDHGYGYEMTEWDHAWLIERLQRVKGAVVLSGYPSPLYDDLMESSGWKTATTNSVKDKQKTAIEQVWIKEAAVCQNK